MSQSVLTNTYTVSVSLLIHYNRCKSIVLKFSTLGIVVPHSYWTLPTKEPEGTKGVTIDGTLYGAIFLETSRTCREYAP